VAGSYQLNAYDVVTGKPAWWAAGLPWQVKPTPVLTEDALYFVTYSGQSDPGQQEIVPPFQEALAKLDRNKDGRWCIISRLWPQTRQRWPSRTSTCSRRPPNRRREYHWAK